MLVLKYWGHPKSATLSVEIACERLVFVCQNSHLGPKNQRPPAKFTKTRCGASCHGL